MYPGSSKCTAPGKVKCLMAGCTPCFRSRLFCLFDPFVIEAHPNFALHLLFDPLTWTWTSRSLFCHPWTLLPLPSSPVCICPSQISSISGLCSCHALVILMWVRMTGWLHWSPQLFCLPVSVAIGHTLPHCPCTCPWEFLWLTWQDLTWQSRDLKSVRRFPLVLLHNWALFLILGLPPENMPKLACCRSVSKCAREASPAETILDQPALGQPDSWPQKHEQDQVSRTTQSNYRLKRSNKWLLF